MTLRLASLCALAVVCGLIGAQVRANEPCPPPPCRSGDPLDPTFEPDRCFEQSAWVAVGRITQVKPRRKSKPAATDYTTFTLRVVSWDKGRTEGVTRIALKVDECSPPLPDATDGLWRFYGVGALQADPVAASKKGSPPADDAVRYLDFARHEKSEP